MRVLDFIVSGQIVKPDPLCDFTGIVPGSRGYLFARFRFSADWAGCKRAAVFVHANGQEYAVPIVSNMCEIPAEALTGLVVRVYIVGQRGAVRIPTNKTAFPQTGRR